MALDQYLNEQISIHALLAESDNRYGRPIDVQLVFLSTLSLRRATVLVWCSCGGAFDFYPRSPCGERHAKRFPALHNILISIHALLAESDGCVRYCTHAPGISIHALLAESDYYFACPFCEKCYFYPRSPCGERLLEQSASYNAYMISIHALLAESDPVKELRVTSNTHFYPRSPCGERPKSDTATAFPLSFLSTLSLRRATSLLCFMIHRL